MKNSDATIIKALEELGLRKEPSSNPPDVEELQKRLADYEQEFGSTLDPEILRKYLHTAKQQ